MTDERPMLCEWCKKRPPIGVLSLPDEPAVHVCQVCVPNSPLFDFRIYPELTK